MFRYTATTEGINKFGLREALQAYADGFWHPAGITAGDVAALFVFGALRPQLNCSYG